MNKKHDRKDCDKQMSLTFGSAIVTNRNCSDSNIIQFDTWQQRSDREKITLENRQLIDKLISYSKKFDW